MFDRIDIGDKEYRTPKTACPDCQMPIDALNGANHDHAPRPGDRSICAYCACLMVINDDMTMRAATQDEIEKLLQNETIRQAVMLVRMVRGTQ